jgi:hypothetical protein
MMSSRADPLPAALSDDVKRDLKSIVLEVRHLFEGDLTIGLRRLGIDAEKGAVTEAASLSYLTPGERETRRTLDAVLAKETAMTKDVPDAVRALLREASYTHLNRLIGLKCLELRGHLLIDGERTEVVTPRADYSGLPKYLWTLRSRDPRMLADPEALWREGLLRACAAASAELGVLFDPTDPYAQVWPSHTALTKAVDALGELPESAYAADELLGWVYQYFQTDEKDRVFEEVKTKKKIVWSDIVPATQLYTERYMVDFLLQNSLGSRWMEMYPGSAAKNAWPYYVESAQRRVIPPQPVKEWTVLDPCCGSGHFLVVAFDLLVQLYGEERELARSGALPDNWTVPEGEVSRTILERNLHGIDIDPRAVQLSALALDLKARDLGIDRTPQPNLVVADCVLERGQSYERLCDAYKNDVISVQAIKAIWEGMEHVRELGSLLRIEEEVETAVAKARERSLGSFDSLNSDWGQYKSQLIARLGDAFAAEASVADERMRVSGVEARKGLDLFELLSSRYDVVCTNPPYMGSGHMGDVEKRYLDQHYPKGRRDAYAAFLLRALELTKEHGLTAMVTRKQWMFSSSFVDLRTQVMESTSLRVVADLGARAFDPDTKLHDGVSVALYVLEPSSEASESRTIVALRATGAPSPQAKARVLRREDASSAGSLFRADQRRLQGVEGCPIAYWLSAGLTEVAIATPAGRDPNPLYHVRDGMNTGDNGRFLRCFWEHSASAEWRPITKGGGYKKWAGNETYSVRWGADGGSIRNAGLAGTRFQNTGLFFVPAACYTRMANGALGVRLISESAFDGTGLPVFPSEGISRAALAALLNSRVATYFCRLFSQSLEFRGGYVERVPRPSGDVNALADVAELACRLKSAIVATDATERGFRGLASPRGSDSDQKGVVGAQDMSALQAVLLTVEGCADDMVNHLYGLDDVATGVIRAETGVPAGCYSLIDGYDKLPPTPIELAVAPAAVLDGLRRLSRVKLDRTQLTQTRDRLRFELAKRQSMGTAEVVEDIPGDSDGVDAIGAHNALPCESLLEELSQKLEINPISVYWLLKELTDQEGLVCPPEAKRGTEDWLSVKLLRMLGHRWPMQDQYEAEEGKPLLDPAWVDPDGIIACTSGLGEETLVERFRRFLDAEFGADRGHEVELGLTNTLGWRSGVEWGKQTPLDLRRWFERDFFKRHVSQFKKRPIAWHLKSPKGSIHLIVYYHTFNRDRLALLRARYLGSLRQEAKGELESALAKGLDDRANVARVEELEERLADLEAFDTRLAQLQEGRDRAARIWCPWKTPEEQPHGWDPDINDGVRVNIAPLQRLGLLAADVLNKKDLNSLLAPEGRG